jgi:hypothetical protein
MNFGRQHLSEVLLRIGVAFAFLYPPINALSNPDSWLGYFPSFMRGFVPDLVLLHAFGALEVLIALWILSGWRIFAPSLLATVMLLAIVGFDYRNFEVIFRDLAIASASAALAVLNAPRRTAFIR